MARFRHVHVHAGWGDVSGTPSLFYALDIFWKNLINIDVKHDFLYDIN